MKNGPEESADRVFSNDSYPRIVGELKGLGITVSATTVRAWLRAAGLGPAEKVGKTTWREFVRGHRQSILAVDFFTSRLSGCNGSTSCFSSS
jgi:hypothetical protein